MTELYAQRDTLRIRRTTLLRKLDLLAEEEQANRQTINQGLQSAGRPDRASVGSFAGEDIDSLGLSDVPELVGQRTVD